MQEDEKKADSQREVAMLPTADFHRSLGCMDPELVQEPHGEVTLMTLGPCVQLLHLITGLVAVSSRKHSRAFLVAVWMLRLFVYAVFIVVAFVPGDIAGRWYVVDAIDAWREADEPKDAIRATFYASATLIYIIAYPLSVFWLAWEGTGKDLRHGGFAVDKLRTAMLLDERLAVPPATIRKLCRVTNAVAGVFLFGIALFAVIFYPVVIGFESWTVILSLFVSTVGNLSLLCFLVDTVVVWSLHLVVLRAVANRITRRMPLSQFAIRDKVAFDAAKLRATIEDVRKLRRNLEDTRNFLGPALLIAVIFLSCLSLILLINVFLASQDHIEALDLVMTFVIIIILLSILVIPALITAALKEFPRRAILLDTSSASEHSELMNITSHLSLLTEDGYMVLGVTVSTGLLQGFASLFLAFLSYSLTRIGSG